ncbi:MAG TPA: molecular chaperone DnaJ [Candidatus Binatia bacterium]|nr:molecular chaperone DnaJ [Candidatus Binatia bacterium]
MAAQPKRDYYEVLGVDHAANAEDIKQAYRQLALQWHPDRNSSPEATDKFREIAEAYAVLSDESKRKAYDTMGHAGVSERWSTEDLFRDFDFSEFFGGGFDDFGNIFGNLFGVRPKRGTTQPRGLDLRYNLNLSLDEAAKGGERLIQLTRSERCRTCNGSGAKPGTQPVSCPECEGKGEKQQVRTDKSTKVITLSPCARCKGRGVLIESPCAACQGTGYEFLPHTIKIQVPAGVDNGMLLRLAGQGEASSHGGTPGDLLVRILIQPHPQLTRDGADLYTVVPISFPDAALGTKVTVPCLNGETVRVTVPAGTQSGAALRARGKGMPRLRGKGKGDLFVLVEVRTPTELTPEQKELLKKFARLEHEQSNAASQTGNKYG